MLGDSRDEVAPDAGESAFEVAAVEELVDDFRDNGAQEAVDGLIIFAISGVSWNGDDSVRRVF